MRVVLGVVQGIGSNLPCNRKCGHGDLDSSGGDVVNKCPVVGYYDNRLSVIHEESSSH